MSDISTIVLYTKDHKKYFDSNLLQYIQNKNNSEVENILQRYRQSESSFKLHQLTDSNRATLLHYAAHYGNEYIVQYLLKSQFEINARNNCEKTPIMLAVAGGHEEVFDVLLQANADIYLIDCKGKNLWEMIFELKSKCLTMLGKFFQHAAWEDLIHNNIQDELAKKLKEAGCTANIVLEWGNYRLMNILLRRKIFNVDQIYDSKMSETLLHQAVKLRNYKMVKVLIANGANVNSLNCYNQIPLFYFCDGGYVNDDSTEFLEALKLYVSRANMLTSSDDSGFMQVSNILRRGNNEAIEIILQSNLNLNELDRKRNTALHYLAQNIKVNLFKLMQDRIFDVNVRNNFGCTPLHIAARENTFDKVIFFVERGADVLVMDDVRNTPLNLIFCRVGLMNKKNIEIFLLHCIDFQNYDTRTHKIFELIISNTRLAAIFNNENLSKVEPVLAYLAIIQTLDMQSIELILEKINLVTEWTNYFNMCRQKLEEMKETKIYSNKTLFGFLTARKNNITVYVRNKESASALKKIIDEFEVDFPFAEILRNRLTIAIKVSETREKAIIAICRLLQLTINLPYYIASTIIDYLSYKDMENLHTATL